MKSEDQRAMHLVISSKAGKVQVACGVHKFLLATKLAVNVTCNDCIDYMARRDREQHEHE